MFYKNAEHCEDKRIERSFFASLFFLALLQFVTVHSTIASPMSTIMIET